MKIYFVTGNRLKFAIAKKVLSQYGIRTVLKKMETPEIQSLNGKEISEYSALYAARKLGAPVLKTDATFSIPALNGFPGPFMKFINHYLTAQDLLRLMQGKKQREIIAIDFLSYARPDGFVKTFSHTLRGRLATKILTGKEGTPGDQLVIWKNLELPQNTLTEAEMINHFAQNLQNWHAAGKYLQTKKK